MTLRSRLLSYRGLRLGLSAVALLALTLAGVVHTPPARAAVLGMIVRQLENSGVVLRAAHLHYNLFTLRAAVDRVEVAARSTADRPFLTADRLTVDVPWRSVLGGSLAVQSLEVLGPRVTVHRGGDGRLNLPTPSSDDAPTEAAGIGPVTLGDLVVRDLHATYIDEPADVDIALDGLTLGLASTASPGAPLSGRFAVGNGVSIRVGEETTRIAELAGRLAFDGTTLFVDDAAIEAPEVRASLKGHLGLLAAEPAVEMAIAGELDLAEVARWVPVDSSPAGRLTFDGRASGPLNDPEVALRLAGNRLAWLGLEDVSLHASGTGSSTGATIEALTVQVAGGSIDGAASVRFDAHNAIGGGDARVEWRELDTTPLISAIAGDMPIRIASQAEGALTATLSGSGLDTLTADAVLTLRGGAANGAVPLSGSAALGVSGGRWTLTHAHRLGSIQLTGSNGGQLAMNDLVGSTLEGDLSIAAADLSTAARDLDRAGVPLPDGFADTLAGQMTARAALGGTFGAPSADLTLDVADLALGQTGPAVLAARAEVTPERGQLTSVELAMGPNRVQGAATIGWQDRALDGRFTVDASDLGILTAGLLPAEWQPAGSFRIEAALAGTADEPTLTGTLDSGAIAVAGQYIERATATFGLTGNVVAVENLTLTQEDGGLSARGRYDLAAARYAIEASASDWEVRPIPAAPPTQAGRSEVLNEDQMAAGLAIEGRFDLQLEGDGTIDAPAGRADLAFTSMRYGDYSIGSGHFDVASDGRRATINGTLEDLRAGVQGTLDLRPPRAFSGTLRVDRAELRRLAGAAPDGTAEPEILPAELEGALALSADVEGALDRIEETRVDLRVELIDASVNGTAVTLDRPARLRYRREDLAADNVALRLGGTQVTLDGRLGEAAPGSELRADVQGDVGELLDLARLIAPDAELSGDGSIAAHVTATGPLTAPVIAAGFSATVATLTYAELPPVTDLAVDATFADGLLRLARAEARWQGASVSATADAPAAIFADYLPASYVDRLPPAATRARLAARFESITQEALAPFVDKTTLANIDAQISGRLDVEATALNAEAVVGRFELDRAELELARVPIGQLEPTRLTLADSRLRVDAFRWGGDGDEIVLTGDLQIGAADPALDFDLDGVLNLRMLGAFLPDVATDGTARVQLAARGTTVEPDINGQIALENIDITVREPRLAITDLAGIIRVARDRLSASDISGSANGGTIAIAGELTYPDLQPGDGTVTLTGRQLAMALSSGARAEVDADLTLALSRTDDPVLRGRITVLRGAYREPISLADLALGDSAAVETVGLDEETLVDRLRLDVALVTAEDLRIDNNYGRAELGANLRMIGTAGQPGLSGRATVREGGQVFLGGNTYAIEQGTIDFADPTRIEPDVNLRARTRIGRYNITLGVSGTLDALENDLQSDPVLSESDIISLLVTGRTLSEAGSAQTEVAREQVLGYLSGDLLGFAGRAVGLDAVRLERGLSEDALPTDLALFAGDEDPSSRLTISKHVSRDVEIVLSQNLRQSGGLTWIAMYRPLPPVELRTISRDDDTRAYEFRHMMQFGGGVRSGAARASAAPPPARVAAVRFTGDAGFDEETLRSVLDLGAGDRFDFFAWQRDRDRLEAFYHDREYLEARISAGREPATGAGEQDALMLTYAVERGPRTTLRAEGHPLPRGLLDDLRESWGRAVFDGFLLDDFGEAIGRHLAGEGYLRPSIEIEVVRPSSAEKTFVIRVDAGARTTDRTIDFAGNVAVPSSRLLAALAPLDANNTAWTDPALVATTLERFYRSEGLLAAAASVGAPVFEGASARLPVTIDEGRRFTLDRVVIEGAALLNDERVRAAADLPEGTTYSAAEVSAARQRVEREYRREGFNSVRTDATANADVEAAAVTVTLTIDEGPQQVLGAISVTGADVTRPHVVTDNLALEPGSVVDLTSWYQARRRLYDTNVFRSVELDLEPIEGSDPAGGEQPVRARVTLEEWPRYRLRYGFQLNDEPGPVAERRRELSPGLVADVQDRNLLGRAASTGVAARLQDDFRIVRGFVSTPTFFGLPIRSSVFVTRSREDFTQEGITPFVEDITGISLEQRLRPRGAFEVAYSYRLENKHVFETAPNPLDPFPIDDRKRIGRFAGSVVAERRDDPFDATRGWFHSSTVEYSPELFGSELRFIKYLAQSYYFRPVGPAAAPLVFASAARFGIGRGFGQDLIPTEKFFVGGATSVRGYPEDSLGELDFFGDPIGGNAFLLFNQEMRFPVFRWIRGVGFLDAGSTFPTVSDLSFGDLVVGVGAGFRVSTPFALVRVDFARALSPREGQRATRWYVSIGQVF